MKRLIYLLALLTLGCGSDNAVTSTSPLTVVPEERVARLAVIAPLDAGLTEFGRGIRDSAGLAVSQARIPGWRIELVAKNDSSDPAVGAQAARELLSVPNLIGVVGTYNSGVAAQVMPILSPAGIVMISPGNTDPTLTQNRPFPTYFRVVATDSVQGPQLAAYAYDTLGLRRAAVVSETKSVSQGLANAFAQAFTGKGGTVTIQRTVPDGATDFTGVMTEVAATNPQMLFFGGEYDVAANARKASPVGPLLGGDGIKDQAYISLAGVQSEGDIASSLGAPLANLPGGAEFARAYAAQNYAQPPSDFGPYAYDAANILLAAFAKRGMDRPGILQEVQATRSTGVTGPLGFDANGDTLNKVLTIYRVTQGRFQPQVTVTVP